MNPLKPDEDEEGDQRNCEEGEGVRPVANPIGGEGQTEEKGRNEDREGHEPGPVHRRCSLGFVLLMEA